MNDASESEKRIRALEAEVGALQRRLPRGFRKRATFQVLGLPAYDIALGPDPATGALRGHAKGFVAIGDLATGVIAIGGLARGLFALGGASLGLFSFGGFSLGLALAFGGCAIGGVALGGAAGGSHAISAERQDPEAEAFFKKWGMPIPRRR